MIKKFNVKKTRQLDRVNKVLSYFYKKPIEGKRSELRSIKNILIIDFALMGDMIMDIPFLRVIKKNCPEASITMVGMPWAEAILGDQDLVDRFIVFDGKDMLSSPIRIMKNYKKIKETLCVINERRYGIGFEPKGDLRHIWFLHCTDCARSISYDYTGGGYLITDSFTPKSDTKHLIDEKLDLLEMSGFDISNEDAVPRLMLSEGSKQLVDQFLKDHGITEKRIIGIHPGASNINKQYQHYPELIERISKVIDTRNNVFAVFEGPGEKGIADAVCEQIKRCGIDHVRVRKSTKEYIALVAMCHLMICNDSAAGHIAAAYGIDTLVIFGPVRPETALPRGDHKVRYVSLDLQCKPCTLPVCPLDTWVCIRNIDLDEVCKKCEDILKHQKG